MAKVLVLQHHPAENLGIIADALASAALAWQYVRVFDGHRVPDGMKGAGGVVVMGGPMGVYEQDRYGFLREEIALIKAALGEGKPVLGVCLGSQLLAAALGAKVSPGPEKEIGWYPVRLAPAAAGDALFGGLPPSFTACHWHGDLFEVPVGATALASSEKTACQAFRYGKIAWGLLFHLEFTAATIEALVREERDKLLSAGVDGAEILRATMSHGREANRIGLDVFGRWAAMVRPG